MTHWIRGAVRRVLGRLPHSGPAVARSVATLKRMSGVSTVEYALILVAVVAAVATAGAAMQGSFDDLFDELDTLITDTEGDLDETTTSAPSTP